MRVGIYARVSTDAQDRHVVLPPKTRAGRRSVVVPGLVAEALTDHLALFAEPGPDGLLFPAPGRRIHSARELPQSRMAPRGQGGRPQGLCTNPGVGRCRDRSLHDPLPVRRRRGGPTRAVALVVVG